MVHIFTPCLSLSRDSWFAKEFPPLEGDFAEECSGLNNKSKSATLQLVGRVGGQRITLRHVSNRSSPNLCLHVSARTALRTWSVLCLDR